MWQEFFAFFLYIFIIFKRPSKYCLICHRTSGDIRNMWRTRQRSQGDKEEDETRGQKTIMKAPAASSNPLLFFVTISTPPLPCCQCCQCFATIAPTREKRKTFIVQTLFRDNQTEFGNVLLVWSCKTIWCQLMDKNFTITLFTHTPSKELIFSERQKSFNLVRPSACRRWLQLDLVKSWWGFERRWSVAGIGLGTSQKFMASRLSLDTPSYPTIPSLTWTSTTTSTRCL